MTSFYKWPPESGHDFLLATQEVLREFQSLGMPHPPFFLFFFCFYLKERRKRIESLKDKSTTYLFLSTSMYKQPIISFYNGYKHLQSY